MDPHAADYKLRDQQRMHLARRYFEWQAKLVRPYLAPRVLEVGCGVGNFTRHLLDRQGVIAIDEEAECIVQLEQNLGNSENVIARQLDILDEAVLDLRRYNIDSIVCLNVLEHVSDDRKALLHMAALLPAGGKAILILPAFASLYGPIDRRLDHFRRYSKSSVPELAHGAGFRVTELRYMNFIGFFGWWFNAHILRKQAQSEAQIVTFDRLIVPVMSRLEALYAPPLGQSLFTVFEKI